jgi:hypothetical protein
MKRITDTDLKQLVDRINHVTGNPMKPYNYSLETGTTANIGCYHLSGAYGGVKLVQICTNGGGERDISTLGYCTKRELYNWINAFLRGMQVNTVRA